MNNEMYSSFVYILKSELVPALGCTEPIAIAFAAAKAKEVLGTAPTHLDVYCSGNIIKNVQGVIVPNSNGKKGIEIAAILGAVGGNSSDELEVLSKVNDEARAESEKLLDTDYCKCFHQKDIDNLYIKIIATSSVTKGNATVIVSGTHTNIVYIEKDGQVLLDTQNVKVEDANSPSAKLKKAKELLSVERIYEFANIVKLEDVQAIIDRQIEFNTKIAKEGLTNDWGTKVGKTLYFCYDNNDVKVRAKAAAAAGSDARMSGCSLPVVINSGSGNQGLTVSLPVIEYAKELKVSHEKLVRALTLANLIALLQKRYIGSLSAFCGAVCASAGAGCGITYLHDGDEKAIGRVLTNVLADVGGIVCDGAKPSCAAKIASSLDAAIMAFEMGYVNGDSFQPGDGLVKSEIEDTVKSYGRLGRKGMKSTDEEILEIMLEK
ncbi:MAG: serine dehydratase subunit alpha family protein [Spirochaetales bacterium]|nr:serine dehydratase subunit alpha family protein [Spirochaetales bacterium]